MQINNNYHIEKADFDFLDVSRVALKGGWRYLTAPKSMCGKILKVTVGVPAYLVLTAVAIVVATMVCLTHIAAIPLMISRPFKLKAFANYYNASIKEVMSLFFAIMMYPIDLTSYNPKTPRKNKLPIILVHGFLHNSSGWFYQLEKLRERLDTDIYTVNLGNEFGTIAGHAESLQKQIQKISKVTGSNEVFLVGHSMGGNVISYYATKLAEKDSVKGGVTIGSPLEGTKMAKAALGKSAREMEFESNFTKELSELIKNSGIPFVHMGSKMDLVIMPMASTIPKHDTATYVEYDVGHATFLLSQNVGNKIVEAYGRVECC